MIDPTNTLDHFQATAAAAAPAVQSTFNAWYLVVGGASAFITHLYHTEIKPAYTEIVAAGGVKKIWKAFWNGPQP